MADVHSPEIRNYNMFQIRAKEQRLRSWYESTSFHKASGTGKIMTDYPGSRILSYQNIKL